MCTSLKALALEPISTSFVVVGANRPLVPISTVPSDKILILSVNEVAPSAVVENTNSPGISLSPGVPSTLANILAAGSKFVPSDPLKFISPKTSLA